jgi:colicin import membrane protein
MRTATTISAFGHGAVLLWSVWSLAARPLANPPVDALPVDIVTTAEFSQMTKGVKDAPNTDKQKPLVEKVAEAKPVEETTAKVVEKKEVKAAHEAPPAPEAKPVEAKPEEKKSEPKPQESKPQESKPQEAKPEKKPAEAKPDAIAQALEKAESKPEPKKLEEKAHAEKTPPPPKKPAPPAPKFDPKRVEALLDKRDPTRVAAAGEAVNNAASLGLANGQAAQLSQTELDAFRRRLEQCWTPPLGVDANSKLRVVLRVLFKPDATVARPPELVAAPASALGPAMADSAKRAILRCQPFNMLKPEHYEQWKDIEINFDPQYMLRG